MLKSGIMTNIFFTGEKSIGKSYAIDKVIKRLGLSVSGFKTYKKQIIPGKLSKVFISDVNHKERCDMLNCVAIIYDEKIPNARTDTFNTIGAKLLQDSDSKIVVMDELGFLEKDATEFEKAVRECLNSNRPVLGALRKKGQAPWIMEALKNNSIIIELDGTNNEEMIEYVISILSEEE